MNEKKKITKGWGIASLVLGILGLLGMLLPYIAIVFSILAVVFFGIQKRYKPTGCGTAGLIIGIIGIVANCIILLFMIIVIFAAGMI